ncbi:hypothetical protein B0H10DRAFT_835460 [Mycena sp. CBHHK59/15]|nr:hypothetical protein B0H10DRAFT_835460 [Mycena sp. CBHHK59/15]
MSVAGSDRATRTSTRAGPSKPVSKAKQKKTKTPSEEEESDDFTAAVRAEGVEDDEILEVEPPRNRKPASRSANGKSAAKGKGKAKADTAPVRRPPSRADIEVVEDTDEAGASGMARAINDATINNRATKLSGRAESSSVTAKQLDRLRRQLESAQNQIHDLSKQLEESYRVRHTEPEDLQQRQVEKYEEIIHSKCMILSPRATDPCC